MTKSPILEVKNLSKDYQEKRVLKNINLRLEKGEILGLLGPNGAGKSTFLKIILGLLKPTTGTIRIFGEELKNLNKERRSKLGFVSDEPNLYEFLTGQEIIRLNRGFYPSWDDKRCMELVEEMQLPLKEKIKHLSRGMKTQLSLILALVPNPEILLMDEPLEGLDPIKRIQLLNTVLEDFMDKENRAIIISSHHLEELERMASKVVFLYQGEIKKESSIDDFKNKEKTIRIVFQKDPPLDLFQMKGIKKISKESNLAYLLAIEENFPAIYEACSRFPHYVLEIYHRNLEDLFYQYQEGEEHE